MCDDVHRVEQWRAPQVCLRALPCCATKVLPLSGANSVDQRKIIAGAAGFQGGPPRAPLQHGPEAIFLAELVRRAIGDLGAAGGRRGRPSAEPSKQPLRSRSPEKQFRVDLRRSAFAGTNKIKRIREPLPLREIIRRKAYDSPDQARICQPPDVVPTCYVSSSSFQTDTRLSTVFQRCKVNRHRPHAKDASTRRL
ncbi:hypothetical protein AWB65_01626 [Caballeronia humi]|uniref:Uncharacterized protein n=1 Tax=Caballeronia humi TaxID=326474 RepID=A0A158G6P0_9BURK|nr:hypothetical protein AWB65_01626 [Caballeronia humi]